MHAFEFHEFTKPITVPTSPYVTRLLRKCTAFGWSRTVSTSLSTTYISKLLLCPLFIILLTKTNMKTNRKSAEYCVPIFTKIGRTILITRKITTTLFYSSAVKGLHELLKIFYGKTF